MKALFSSRSLNSVHFGLNKGSNAVSSSFKSRYNFWMWKGFSVAVTDFWRGFPNIMSFTHYHCRQLSGRTATNLLRDVRIVKCQTQLANLKYVVVAAKGIPPPLLLSRVPLSPGTFLHFTRARVLSKACWYIICQLLLAKVFSSSVQLHQITVIKSFAHAFSIRPEFLYAALNWLCALESCW